MANENKYIRSAGTPTSEEDDNLSADEPAGKINSEQSDNRSTSSSDDDSSSSSDSETDGTTRSSEIDENRDEAVISNPNTVPNSSSTCSSVTRPSQQAAPVSNPSHDAEEHVRNSQRNDWMEKMLMTMNETLSRFQPNPKPTMNDKHDNNWNLSNDLSSSCESASGSTSSSIRWDHMKPFPSGIAANKMWEEWNRYIDNFEIAASLSNVNNPVKRTQLLYLSMGNELQDIIKAAKLIPSLANPDCYKTFVSNIKNYLRSMTDTAAEHEAFSRMKQENGEPAVAFHARLTCKVRSCNYSVDDEDRFVRAQLLSGLRNRELVKHARTYGYETNFIVQSATRDEAFEAETRPQEGSSVFEVGRVHRSSSYDRSNRKRPNAGSRIDEPLARQHRNNELNQRSEGRRTQCKRCFLFSHRNGKCPALSRDCNNCGKRGHYEAVCRQRQVNFMHNERNDRSMDGTAFSGGDKREDIKQVLKD